MASPTCCPVVECVSPDCLQLTEREMSVCREVCTSSEPVAFSTIRGRLGYHQEVTSRILRRLTNYVAIERVEGKYRRVSQ